MASTTETGHAKNVAIFEDLITICTGFGEIYNPAKKALKIEGLTTQLTAAQNSLMAVRNAKAAYNNATNAREVAFKPVKALATKIMGALNATDALQQTIDDARTITNKIQGKRAKAIKVPDAAALTEGEEPAKTVSTSQQSYDSLAEHFSALVSMLGLEAHYTPNENDLQVTALNTRLTDMKAKNTIVLQGLNNITNARINRDKILYAPNTGVVDTALAVKEYVKSIFGVTSPQYRQVSGLRLLKHSII